MDKGKKSSVTIDVMLGAPMDGEDGMADSQVATTALIPVLERVLDRQTQPGVSARVLYEFLELNPTVWARWTKKNIVNNPYALEHIDLEGFLPDVENRTETTTGGRPTQDYVLSLDFAKRLAMMARSAKGEEARQYFLDCEKTVVRYASLPQVKNPAHQLMIDTVVRIDTMEQELHQYQVQLMTHQQAMLVMQAQQIEALQRAQSAETTSAQAEVKADQADAKAALALDDAHRMTVEDFIFKNGLVPQFPPPMWRGITKWLADFCQLYNLYVDKKPVVGKPWPEEKRYPLQAFQAWHRQALRKPQQIWLVENSQEGRDTGCPP